MTEQTIERAAGATPAAPPLTRAERVERITFYEQLAAAARDQAREYRDALAVEAQREHEQGCVASWRVLGLGLVYGRATNDRVDVADAAALVAWVEQTRPTEVETIVRPAFLDLLRKTGRPGPDGTVLDKEGQPIPGLRFTPGGKFDGVAYRADDDAKEAYAEAAAAALARLTDVMYAAEGAAQLAGEVPGELAPGEIG